MITRRIIIQWKERKEEGKSNSATSDEVNDNDDSE